MTLQRARVVLLCYEYQLLSSRMFIFFCCYKKLGLCHPRLAFIMFKLYLSAVTKKIKKNYICQHHHCPYLVALKLFQIPITLFFQNLQESHYFFSWPETFQLCQVLPLYH